jgi:hypothetical protein
MDKKPKPQPINTTMFRHVRFAQEGPKTQSYLDEVNSVPLPGELGYIYPEDIAKYGENNYLKSKASAITKVFPQLNYDIAYNMAQQSLSETIKQKLSNWQKEEKRNQKLNRSYKSIWPNSYNEDKWPIPKYN